ncbi:MAG: endonuclease MutS2 [Chloroflexota bacterium]
MNTKSAQVLELPKILEQLVNHSTFSAGAELIRQLAPTGDIREALAWQQETTEARTLFDIKTEIGLGGARDVRPAAIQSTRGFALEPQTFLDIRSTLRRATTIRRTLSRLNTQFPTLAEIAELLEECQGLQSEIALVLDDNGNILDTASPRLAIIRRDLRVSFDRLQTRLMSLVNNPNNARFLQEQLITQRHGRYVIPLRAEFKGRIPGIVHDQSSSGATVFVEPLATVELNNTWRELQLEEENEIRRILQALTDQVAHEAEFIIATVDGLAHIDMIFAKARYANALRATAPKLVPFHPREDSLHPGSTIKLTQARHPLLPSRTVVPIDLVLDEETYTLVITGPNTGGKTVALKTIGLLALMAQCGLHIPAEDGAELSVFEGIFADIGDEQSIEQSLSTFSAHMTNTINILQEADSRSLVILDELGAGTDPAEGSALARAILSYLLERSVTTLVTTHHPELKVYSHDRPGVRNASVEFDLQTLRPTYHLIVGIPGRSNALAIATRLGIPADIIADARTMVGAEEQVADELLDEISRTREETRIARDASLVSQARAEELKRELRQRLDEVEVERREVIAQTRRVAERELDDLRSEVRRLRHSLQAAGQPLEAIKRVEADAFNLKNTIEAPIQNVTEIPDFAEETRPEFRLGETVWITPLKSEGEIIELSGTEAEVSIGRLRVRAKLDELQKRSASERKAERGNRGGSLGNPALPTINTKRPERERSVLRANSPGLELDLRGTSIQEAVERVENYIDAAYVAGLPFVRIIHGKGTGALRQAIRDLLHDHPLVQRYERGGEKEGGDGVTVVNLSELD